MFNIGFQELLIIAVIALIVFGPNKLPELAKAFGKAMREFKKATDEVKESFQAETEDFKELKNNLMSEKDKFLAGLLEENTEIAETSPADSTRMAETVSLSQEESKGEKDEKDEPEGLKKGTPSHG